MERVHKAHTGQSRGRVGAELEGRLTYLVDRAEPGVLVSSPVASVFVRATKGKFCLPGSYRCSSFGCY